MKETLISMPGIEKLAELKLEEVMNNLSEKINKAFEENNELCLVEECPKGFTCGECWNKAIEKYINIIYNKAIDEVCEYLKLEWSLERINTFGDFDKIADKLHR